MINILLILIINKLFDECYHIIWWKWTFDETDLQKVLYNLPKVAQINASGIKSQPFSPTFITSVSYIKCDLHQYKRKTIDYWTWHYLPFAFFILQFLMKLLFTIPLMLVSYIQYSSSTFIFRVPTSLHQ